MFKFLSYNWVISLWRNFLTAPRLFWHYAMYSVTRASLFHVWCVTFRNRTVEEYLWKTLRRYLQFSWPSFISACSSRYIFYVSSSKTYLLWTFSCLPALKRSNQLQVAVLFWSYDIPCNPVSECQHPTWACGPTFRPGASDASCSSVRAWLALF